MRSARNDKHSMKLHILGIAGTFMGGVAALARELGHAVEGSDQNIYPPMSTQLEQLGIALKQGYSPRTFQATATRSWSAMRCRAAMRRSSTCSMPACATRPARSG
jgi:UDP-N-acetylmuramate-alanine ligase